MRIESITITGYRSFGKTDNKIMLNPGVTTIVGMNGSGKSNLIDIIGSINLVTGKVENAKAPNRNRTLNQEITVKVRMQPLSDQEKKIRGILFRKSS